VQAAGGFASFPQQGRQQPAGAVRTGVGGNRQKAFSCAPNKKVSSSRAGARVYSAAIGGN